MNKKKGKGRGEKQEKKGKWDGTKWNGRKWKGNKVKGRNSRKKVREVMKRN